MAKNNKTKKQTPIEWAVDNVRQWKDGGISFSLTITVGEDRPLTIYGCRVADGKKGGNFVSFPSRKGSDGKYYSHAYIRLTDEEQDDILDAVMDQVEDE